METEVRVDASRDEAARCPICGARVRRGAEPVPFCSARCRDVDLGNWLIGNYRISMVSQTHEDDGQSGVSEGPPGETLEDM